MRLVVGLGNPGEAYAETRHNLGFRVVERYAARAGARFGAEECAARVAEAHGAVLALAQTFMNRSGFAVRCLAERLGTRPSDVLVVFDDVALPLGRVRLRARGGAGGHRGMESVIENLQSEEVARLRLGIAPEAGFEAGADLAPFVLAPFTAAERELVEEVVGRGADAVAAWLVEGAEAAMNRFNA
ncbi:MAG: aminoacyl-tRNA hydrolase [Thermoanaerobaculia bacterium]|nr:MAG: aminoacyl-tRNA hydrolase [Thermoanaerobaculia bacterium]